MTYSNRAAYSISRLVRCYLCGEIGGAFYIAQTDRFGITHESDGSGCKHYIGPRTVRNKTIMLQEQIKIGEVLLKDSDPYYSYERHSRLIEQLPSHTTLITP